MTRATLALLALSAACLLAAACDDTEPAPAQETEDTPVELADTVSETVCCVLAQGSILYGDEDACAASEGIVADESVCENPDTPVCCDLHGAAEDTTLAACVGGGGAIDGPLCAAANDPQVCCLFANGLAKLDSTSECAADGGTAAEVSVCTHAPYETCCALGDTHGVMSNHECLVAGGEIVEDDTPCQQLPEVVCCLFLSGLALEIPPELCDDQGGVQADLGQCGTPFPVCCQMPNGQDWATNNQQCLANGGAPKNANECGGS